MISRDHGDDKKFDKKKERSWKYESCSLGKLKVCAMKCGAEFDPFAEQFK